MAAGNSTRSCRTFSTLSPGPPDMVDVNRIYFINLEKSLKLQDATTICCT